MKPALSLLAALLLAVCAAGFHAEPTRPGPAEDPSLLVFEKWLRAGPVPVPKQAYSVKEKDELASAYLDSGYLDRSAWIEAGMEMSWFPGAAIEWVEVKADEGQVLFPNTGGTAEPGGTRAVAFLAGYVTSTKRQEVTFTVTGNRPFALFIDGEEKTRSTAQPAEGEDPAEERLSAVLIRGKHRVLVKTVSLPGKPPEPWTIRVKARPDRGSDTLSLSTSPVRTFADMNEARRLSRITSFAPSPDGECLAVSLTERKPGVRGELKRLLFLDIESGKTMDSLDARQGASDLKWSPDGRSLTFKSRGDLLCYEPETQTTRTLLKGVKGLGKYVWFPDSRFVCYARSDEKEKLSDDYYRLEGLYSRLTDYSETKTLHIVSVESGVSHALTTKGNFAIEDFALSPDGKAIACVKRKPIVERPFFKTELRLISFPEGEESLLAETDFPFENMPSDLTWSPDGKRVAFTGPPGEIKDGGKEHNFFDSDLWIADVTTGSLTRLSDRFDETVNAPLFWHPDDGRIYFTAHHRTRKHLARIDVEVGGGIELLHGEPAVVARTAAAAGGKAIAFTGSSIDSPAALYALELDGLKTRLLLDPNRELMERMRLGRFERFDFTNSREQLIDGFLFYPPDFDRDETYPLIVYYYGGTTPEVENFSVTYYHFIPANGYMLYVVNPAGAFGYGEAFSDLHVNDWGELAAADIIEGVKALLAAKDFIDPHRIGGYGGSYGGFTTLSLITKTDLFKASCSLYGISNIASYWGAGIWGYTYGDTALAKSYPWNRPDIFVKRSPLFNADKIESALLLLHGTDDVNVPSAESEQMFTALKVLGKEVAYVRFPGEGHGIAGGGYDIYCEHRRIMLEWFDKHLKSEPGAWADRW